MDTNRMLLFFVQTLRSRTMKVSTIILQFLGFYSRNTAANKFLREPTQRVVESGSESRRMRYLRVDAVPNSMSAMVEGWEEELEGEVVMEYDQLGKLFEDAEETIMDTIFEVEQIEATVKEDGANMDLLQIQ